MRKEQSCVVDGQSIHRWSVVWPAVKLLAHRRWSESVGGSKQRAEVDHPSVRWAWAARAWAVGGVSHERILRESSEI